MNLSWNKKTTYPFLKTDLFDFKKTIIGTKHQRDENLMNTILSFPVKLLCDLTTVSDTHIKPLISCLYCIFIGKL